MIQFDWAMLCCAAHLGNRRGRLQVVRGAFDVYGMHAVNVARRVCSNKRCTIMCFWFSICVSEGWSNSDCDMRAEKPHCRDCFPRPGTRRTTFWLHWASPENSGPLFAIVGMSPLPPLDEVLHVLYLACKQKGAIPSPPKEAVASISLVPSTSLQSVLHPK